MAGDKIHLHPIKLPKFSPRHKLKCPSQSTRLVSFSSPNNTGSLVASVALPLGKENVSEGFRIGVNHFLAVHRISGMGVCTRVGAEQPSRTAHHSHACPLGNLQPCPSIAPGVIDRWRWLRAWLIERHDSSFGTSVRLMHGIPTQYIIGRTADKRGPMFS